MNIKKILIIVFLGFGINSFAQQKAELISFAQLEKMINDENGTTFIINFWATWCGPCLAELPDFQKFHDKNTDKNVKLLMVSFDFPNEIKKVNKFIERKNLKPSVYLISDSDQNAFIDQVSKNWQGTIPATWFVNNKNGKKLFVEKPISELEINKYLQEIN